MLKLSSILVAVMLLACTALSAQEKKTTPAKAKEPQFTPPVIKQVSPSKGKVPPPPPPALPRVQKDAPGFIRSKIHAAGA
ncbi:hypothetical protein [Chitinophaga barathri]|uniref:Uncharacterized protein n=1 Tax=Chitinophaga barathri TaxID=1647451 RepID=A0A3N4M9Z2_9BACT|nr:hypothetical protein [Chitinophaga barathri]RPD38486.1 hypothetical protein EG028_24780 [Chitinophaga barathri]